jgi:hypothetical protein
MHRAAGCPAEARGFLREANTQQIPSSGSSWIGGVALFELAALELREAQRLENEDEVARRANASEKSSVNSSSSSDDGSNTNGGGGAAGEEPEKQVTGVYGVGRARNAGAGGIDELRVRVGALALGDTTRARWTKVLKEAGALLDAAMGLSGSEVDLSSRLESRVAMLRDEIALKREMLGQR